MEREIIFEFITIGSAVKVTAVDVMTAIEVSTITPSSLSQKAQRDVARKKLIYVLQKQNLID